jgi:hypothetical protein
MFVAPGAEPSLGIDWSIRSLATFIGVLFIVQGAGDALTTAFSARRLLPSFEVKRLPDDVARTWSSLENGQAPHDARPEATRLAATPS